MTVQSVVRIANVATKAVEITLSTVSDLASKPSTKKIGNTTIMYLVIDCSVPEDNGKTAAAMT
jgi:hypothetical protein